MTFQFNIDPFHHVPTLLISIINYCIFGFMFYQIDKTNDLKPKRWKAFIVMLVGMFTFFIHLSFFHHLIKLPILPLGVWILMMIMKRNDNLNRWEGYRRFAWTGFLINFIFLVTSLFLKPIDQFLYPKEQLRTYISDLTQPQIILANPNIPKAKLLKFKLLNSLNSFHKENIMNEKWYYETFDGNSKVNHVERFPYILLGVKPKFGSGLDSLIYIEKDGKGLLITTSEKQYYFRSNTKIISSTIGGNTHVN